jgi:ribosomal protein S18 acetylase RimI-like enzyme
MVGCTNRPGRPEEVSVTVDIRLASQQDRYLVDRVSELHERAFQGFFLTELGRGFLRTYYQSAVEAPQSGLLCAREEGQVIGFVAFTESPRSLYAHLVSRHWPALFWYVGSALFRQPSLMSRFLAAIKQSRVQGAHGSKGEGACINVTSVAVDPERQGQGIGTSLIKALVAQSQGSAARSLRLETDADNNEAGNRFYTANGFTLSGTYVTRLGRAMNEYTRPIGSGDMRTASPETSA